MIQKRLREEFLQALRRNKVREGVVEVHVFFSVKVKVIDTKAVEQEKLELLSMYFKYFCVDKRLKFSPYFLPVT